MGRRQGGLRTENKWGLGKGRLLSANNSKSNPWYYAIRFGKSAVKAGRLCTCHTLLYFKLQCQLFSLLNRIKHFLCHSYEVEKVSTNSMFRRDIRLTKCSNNMQQQHYLLLRLFIICARDIRFEELAPSFTCMASAYLIYTGKFTFRTIYISLTVTCTEQVPPPSPRFSNVA